MKICGIIAEYDPFHNGHAWQLSQARRISRADIIVCVISGRFTQRGMPALFSPHLRARAALLASADLVLQMPFSFSVSNAERFSQGGVSILKQLGVQALSFGVEAESIPWIDAAAMLLENPTEEYRTCLRQALDDGVSFPKAQGIALAKALNVSPDVFSMPNASLAICYARANLKLHANMALYPVPRSGRYHDAQLHDDGPLPSATAVRGAIAAGDWPLVKSAVPPFSAALLEHAVSEGDVHPPHALDPLLRWRLRSERDFSQLPDLSEGIENKLSSAANCLDRNAMILSVKSKRYSYARISRLLTHALLGTRSDLLSPTPEYAYVLGFRQEASPLLRAAHDNGFPIFANAQNNFSYDMDLDIQADDLWNLGAGKPFGAIFREKPVIL
ncbi:MAG: nucleotidyltransferase family protein [Clostridia bacterium]|nr:nucleotidyltransferase family protein [Clostridia bacterium]